MCGLEPVSIVENDLVNLIVAEKNSPFPLIYQHAAAMTLAYLEIRSVCIVSSANFATAIFF
jgi:hypothetical protein